MPSAPHMKYGPLLFVAAFVVSALLLYGGAELVESGGSSETSGDGSADGGGPAGGPVSVRLVAKDLTYNPRSVRASTGAEVTITLDNQDAGVLHNIAFYTDRSATNKIFASELVTGPIVQNFRFTAPSSPGNYFFRCDVHPDTMSGSFSVR